MKTILLTGANGFIGRNIKESYLAQKYNLLTPLRAELDCADTEAVQAYFNRHNIDIVIHSAAKAGHRNAKDTSMLFYNNTRMFFNLEQQKHRFERMIVIGSGAIYDQRHYRHLMYENDLSHIPIDEHGLCKYVCGKYIEELQSNVIDLRVFGIFGKYEDYAIRFISNMICKNIFDIPYTMHQDRLFSYLYIDDLMPILEAYIENTPQHHSYNITPNTVSQLSHIPELINKISNKDLPLICSSMEMGLPYTGANDRLMTEFPETQFTPIDKSIVDLYQWYLEHVNEIDKELLMTNK